MTQPILAAPDLQQPLSDWLNWLETIHPVAIDMGLERVSLVADRLKLYPANKPLILVGGTNGKGSTVAMLSSIYRNAGYRVGAYTSPHISHFCERIRVNGKMVDEAAVVNALAFIEQGRAPETLTYFEYTTLAAMHVFTDMQCDVLLLEVGLGGRLDATNIWDADCSIITSIALDHEAYLGSDVSVIATEKAAIGRKGKPFIVGEKNPPSSLADYASAHEFDMIDVGSLPLDKLPQPAMPGEYQRRNAGCAVAAIKALESTLPVSEQIITASLSDTRVAGRFERVMINDCVVIMDVAHNPAGAAALTEAWMSEFGTQKADIVFAAMADKDIESVVGALNPLADTWHCASLNVPRAIDIDGLSIIVKQIAKSKDVAEYASVAEALQSAFVNVKKGKRAVLVAGSFYTIADAKSALAQKQYS